MEQEPKLEKNIFEIVKADDNLRTENCIVINIPEKTSANDIINLAKENNAVLESEDELYAVQFLGKKQELYNDAKIREFFYDIENKYDTAA